MAGKAAMTNGANSGDAANGTKRACIYVRVSTASKTKHDPRIFNQNPDGVLTAVGS
jgi:hypothetical protein